MRNNTNYILLASIFISACSAATDAKPNVVSPNHPGNGRPQIGEPNYSIAPQPSSLFETHTNPIQPYNIVIAADFSTIYITTETGIFLVYTGDTDINFHPYISEDDGNLIVYEGPQTQVTGETQTIELSQGDLILVSWDGKIYIANLNEEDKRHTLIPIEDKTLEEYLSRVHGLE